MGYKDDTTFDFRQEQSEIILRRHPTHRPFIIESKKFHLDRTKFLVPSDINMGQLMYVVRKRLKLDPGDGIFFLIDNIMPNAKSLVAQVYQEYSDEDGFCYIEVTKENVFG